MISQLTGEISCKLNRSMIGYTNLSSTNKMFVKDIHGEILLQWSPALRTPALHGQFRLSRQKAHIFSLKLPRLYGHRSIRTTDIFLCPESQTLIYCQPRFMDNGYLHTVYFHCHNGYIITQVSNSCYKFLPKWWWWWRGGIEFILEVMMSERPC